jgi:hypothetical protein
MKLYRLWLSLGLTLLLAATGCIFSPDDDPEDPPPPVKEKIPQLTQPDSVAAAYRIIYDDQDIDEYRDLLHPDFKFIIKGATSPDENYNYDTEIAITNKIFTGQPGTGDPPAPPIQSIDITMVAQGSWLPIADEDPNFGGTGGQYRPYQMDIFFQRSSGSNFIVRGEALFYVIPVENDDLQRTEYRLLGIVDRTNGS